MTGVYLEVHPPARTQYRAKRRAAVTGSIVVHTAEAGPDTLGADGTAEAVASFISTRTDAAASYHSVADSDSIVQVCRYEWEAFHEGTGGNRFSLGLSLATRAHLWPSVPEKWRNGALRNAAIEAANMARWVFTTCGVAVPARRITAAEYRAGKPGFIGHGDLDPTRRSDPGAEFPWGTFLYMFVEEMTGGTVEDFVELTSTLEVLADDMSCFGDTMKTVVELYETYRGANWSLEEIQEWGRDVARKLARRENIVPTLEYVQYALEQEWQSGQLLK